MTLTLSTRRPGAGCPLSLGILALLLGAAALFVALCRDPLQPGFVFRNPTSEPLEGYDFSTAAGTAKSEIQIQLNGDVRAMAELGRRVAKEKQELFDTLNIGEQLDYKEPPKKGDTLSGDFKILLVSFKAGGEEKKQAVVYERDNASGLWQKVDPKPVIEAIERKDKEAAKKIRDWLSPAKK